MCGHQAGRLACAGTWRRFLGRPVAFSFPPSCPHLAPASRGGSRRSWARGGGTGYAGGKPPPSAGSCARSELLLHSGNCFSRPLCPVDGIPGPRAADPTPRGWSVPLGRAASPIVHAGSASTGRERPRMCAIQRGRSQKPPCSVADGIGEEANPPGSWGASSTTQRRCPRSISSTSAHLQLWPGSFSGGVRVLATLGGPVLSRAGGRLFIAMEQAGGRELFVV